VSLKLWPDSPSAALKANPDATLTTVAEIAGVSRATVVNARDELAAEARKEARKSRETSKTAKPTERERAHRFLKDALAHGPTSKRRPRRPTSIRKRSTRVPTSVRWRKKQQVMQTMPMMPTWPTPPDAPGNIAPVIEVDYKRLPN